MRTVSKEQRALPDLWRLTLKNRSPASKKAAILELLRRVARQYQGAQPRRFYSIRAVAARFGVSPTLVARHYQQLRADGLLFIAWGATTMIAGSQTPPEPEVCIIPISIADMAASKEYRGCVLRLRRQLSYRGISNQHLVLFESGRVIGERLLGQRR